MQTVMLHYTLGALQDKAVAILVIRLSCQIASLHISLLFVNNAHVFCIFHPWPSIVFDCPSETHEIHLLVNNGSTYIS